MATILVLHGPNLNLLGEREPDVYGRTTLEEINQRLAQLAQERGHQLMAMQSNAEFELVDRIQAARRFVNLYPTDEDYAYVGQEKYRQIREHGIGTVETRWQHTDGHVIDVLLSSTPMDPDDHDVGVTFTAQDITARNAALRRQQDLEHVVETR